MRRLITLSAAAALLAACQTLPTVNPVTDVVADRYPVESAFDAETAAHLDWRSVFIDPRLQQLVDIALSDSRPLRLALLEADAAQTQLRMQRSSFWPQIGATGAYTRSRNGFSDDVQSQAQAGLGLSTFELDLFGKLRAQSAAAFQSYLAAGEGAQAARIALSAAVADAYVATLAAREQAALTEATLEDWRTSERLTRQLYAAGQVDGSDVASAEAQVRTAEADLQAARRNASVAENALTLVVGRPLTPGLLEAASLEAGPVLTRLPVGLPSDLLIRRPDIRQAERSLFAAQADIRAARRAFLPSIALTGQYGYASSDLGKLFDGPEVWSFTPQISVPIFQGGRLQAQLDLSVIRQNAAVASYEWSIQRAFAEVADGLAARETFDGQINAQRQAVAAAARRVELAEARYRAGAASRLELLDAQRQLYGGRMALLNAQAAQSSASVALYRALGGGPTADPAGE